MINDGDELTDLNTHLLEVSCDIHDERVQGVYDLNLVQKSIGFSLYTVPVTTTHHVVAVHDFIQDVATLCAIGLPFF